MSTVWAIIGSTLLLHIEGVMITDRWLAGEDSITVSSLLQICHGGRLVDVFAANGLQPRDTCDQYIVLYLTYLQTIIGDCYKLSPDECVAIEWSRSDVGYACSAEEDNVQRMNQTQIILTATCTQPDYVDQTFRKIILDISTQFVTPTCSDGQMAQVLHAGFASTCAKPADYVDQHANEDFLATVRGCFSQSSTCTVNTFNPFISDLRCIEDDGTEQMSPEHSLIVTWGCPSTDVDYKPATHSSQTTEKISTNKSSTAQSTAKQGFVIALIVVAVLLGVVIVIMIILAVCYIRTKAKQTDAIYSLESAFPVPALPANSELHGSARRSFKKKKCLKESKNGAIELDEPQPDEYLIPAKPYVPESSSKTAVMNEYSGVSQDDDEDPTYDLPWEAQPNHKRKLPDTPKSEYAPVDK